MAMLLVQQCIPPKTLPNDIKTQDRVQIEGVSLGGQAAGSKYNTRVCYMPVMKGNRNDDPLNDPRFAFYEGYFIEYLIEMLKSQKPIQVPKSDMILWQVIARYYLYMKQSWDHYKRKL